MDENNKELVMAPADHRRQARIDLLRHVLTDPIRLAKLSTLEVVVLQDLLQKPVSEMCATCDKWLTLYIRKLELEEDDDYV